MDHWALTLITGMMGGGLVMLWYISETLRKIHALLRTQHNHEAENYRRD